MKILHIVAGLEESNGMANTARQFAEEERAQGHESAVSNDLSALDTTVNVVYLHGAWLPILWRAAKRARRLGVKLVIRPAGSYDPVRLAYHGWKKRAVSFFEHRMLKRADVVLATCHAEEEWIRKYEPRVKKIELTDLKRFFRLGDCGIVGLWDCGIERLGDCGIERLGDCGIKRLRDCGSERLGDCGIERLGDCGSERLGDCGIERLGDCGIERLEGTKSHNPTILQSYNPTIRKSGKSRPLHILYLGRRHPLKGVEYLEAAVAEIVSGCQPSDAECPVSSPVELRIVSNAFGEEKERVWEWCDVLVLPTLSENFGRVVAEALERGKRVITTDGAPAWGEGLRDCGIVGLRDCGIGRDCGIERLRDCGIERLRDCGIERLRDCGIGGETCNKSDNQAIKKTLNGRIMRGYGGQLYYLVGYREGSRSLRIQLLKRAIEIVGLWD